MSAPVFSDRLEERHVHDLHALYQNFAHPELAAVIHLELFFLPELLPFYEKLGFSTEMGGVRLMRRNAG